MSSSSVEHFKRIESSNGLRCTWNVWPSSKQAAVKLSVPVSMLYSPMKQISGLKKLPYKPVMCPRCRSVLNPYCSINFERKTYLCPFCENQAALPASYNAISTECLPAEVMPQFTTVEYVRESSEVEKTPPIFMFVLDITLREEQLQSAIDGIQYVISTLPEYVRVGLITFGTVVQVHELTHDQIPRVYMFRGHKAFSEKDIEDYLELKTTNSVKNNQKFVMSMKDCALTLSELLDTLKHDPWPVTKHKRPYRCTGAALNVASSVLAALYPLSGSRIVLITGGPCTLGPGQVVSTDLEQKMRSQRNIEKKEPEAKLVAGATKFYTELARRMARSFQCTDIFCGSVHQCGLLEMRPLLDLTGGRTLIAEACTDDSFRFSFEKLFEGVVVDSSVGMAEMAGTEVDEPVVEGEFKLGFSGVVEMSLPKDVLVSGCIGQCATLPVVSTSKHMVSTATVGQGGTNRWRMCGLDSESTLAFILEVGSKEPSMPAQGAVKVVQFRTVYTTSTGDKVMRVSTVGFPWVDGSQKQVIGSGFDEDAAAVVMSRIASWRCDMGTPEREVTRSIDRTLIRLVSLFAQYQRGMPHTFALTEGFQQFPQTMFHFRRSPFMQTFGYSPDEVAFSRHLILRECLKNSMIMIRPTLTAFRTDDPAGSQVILDSTSAKNDSVLLLDCFTEIIVWVGEAVVSWREQGIHEQPDYANVKQMLEQPLEDAQRMILERFPAPRLYTSDQGKSQQRRLLARLNPSATHKRGEAAGGEIIITDDVNLQKFLDSLKHAATEQ
ncbi:Protein transport protein Sec23A [Aduncisulcus paluster]|uniref:Protein transport protein SEC23 n=1 Tax=Aduncisulcus paluster TaxID=2918883 RepID=A0ABQ5KSA6_9EUKA|nr:Protein transport protein Sec23A [Aduncisulcus paluster]